MIKLVRDGLIEGGHRFLSECLKGLPIEGGSHRDVEALGKLGTSGYPVIKHKAGELSQRFWETIRKELADNCR